jgi:hypothetical protein
MDHGENKERGVTKGRLKERQKGIKKIEGKEAIVQVSRAWKKVCPPSVMITLNGCFALYLMPTRHEINNNEDKQIVASVPFIGLVCMKECNQGTSRRRNPYSNQQTSRCRNWKTSIHSDTGIGLHKVHHPRHISSHIRALQFYVGFVLLVIACIVIQHEKNEAKSK